MAPHSEGIDFGHLIGHHLADAALFFVGGFGFTKHMLMMTIAAAIIASLVLSAARGAGKLRTVLEAFVLFIRRDITEPYLGHDGDAFLPYFLTLFLFIFIMNLLGLVPWGASATANISVTGALSLSTFLLIHGSGMVRHGPIHHFRNLIPHGVPWWVMPLIFAIEFMGYITKCIALCLRLFANMTAGHLVILIVLGLILLFGQMSPAAGLVIAPVSVGLALGLYMLEMIVAVVQAYVFTVLTAIFVGGSLHPEH